MKQESSILYILFTVCLLGCTSILPTNITAEERVYLDITSAETRKLKFAVPWFINTALPDRVQKVGRDMSQTLSDALEFHGIISVIPAQQYGGSQSQDWKKLGVDYVIKGTYNIGPHKTRYELRLFDIAAGDQLPGKGYTGAGRNTNTFLYKFTDHVIKVLTGQKGIAQSQIIYISDRSGAKEIYQTDILGKNIRQITRHRNLVVSPRISPDGRHLAYSSYHRGNQNLYVTDLSQNKTTRPLSRRKGLNLAPAWSPDGKKLILTLSKDGNPDLYLIDRQGKIIKRLTKPPGINVSPTWSPNGKKVVFVSDRSRKPQMYILDLATNKIQLIRAKGSENSEPSWSPDGSLLAFSSRRGKHYQICIIKPVKGAQSVQITKGDVNHESPAWSPDGRQIIYSQRDGKRQRLYAINKNGSNQRLLLDLPGNLTYPRWANKNY